VDRYSVLKTDKGGNLVTRPRDVNAGAHQKRLWPGMAGALGRQGQASGGAAGVIGDGPAPAWFMPQTSCRGLRSRDSDLEHRVWRKSTRQRGCADCRGHGALLRSRPGGLPEFLWCCPAAAVGPRWDLIRGV